MRYIEFMSERDNEKVIRVLRDLIARPSTNDAERENARRSLDRLLDKNSNVPDNDEKSRRQFYGGFNPFSHKIGKKIDIKV